jgi:predicted transcriptional regulator
MNKKTLNIGVSSLDDGLAQFAKVWKDASAGKHIKTFAGIGFATGVQLLTTLTSRRFELINALKETGALSIYALAKHLERNYSNVHSDIGKLLELGIVEKDAEGRVFVPWDEIDVQLPLQRLAA